MSVNFKLLLLKTKSWFQLFCSFFYPHFVTPSLWLHPIMLKNYIGIIAQLLCVMIISINRMTVIILPLRAEKVNFSSNLKTHSVLATKLGQNTGNFYYILLCLWKSMLYPFCKYRCKGWPYINSFSSKCLAICK